jgi:glycerol uptake facilitator protein
MSPFLAEFIGTAVLLFLGTGVVANVSLNKTKAFESSPAGKWILITTAWGFAVFFGVIISGAYSGAHLNPAVTIGFAFANKFTWSSVPEYVLAQLLGSMLGAAIAYLFYSDHIRLTSDENTIKGCFSTEPAVRNKRNNFFSECAGTFMLVFLIFFIARPILTIDGLHDIQYGIGSMDAFPVGVLVWVIGMTLGGTTGYAINPARDLGPRIIYALFRGRKAKPDWSYSWIPVLGPIAGGVLAGVAYSLLI